MASNVFDQARNIIKNFQSKQSPWRVDNPVIKASQAVAAPLVWLQRQIEQPPQFNFAQNIQNPVGRFGAEIAQGALNQPARSIQAAGRIGSDIRFGTTTPQRLVGNTAEAAMFPLMFTGIGAGKTIAKQFVAPTIRQAVTKGVISGTKTGAGFGALQGLADNRNAPNLQSQFIGAIPTALGGAAFGGLLGGGAAGLANLPLAGLKAVIRKLRPNATDQEATILAGGFLRFQTTGRFAKSKAQWAGQVAPLDQLKLDQNKWTTRSIPKLNAEIEAYLKDKIPQPGLSIKYTENPRTQATGGVSNLLPNGNPVVLDRIPSPAVGTSTNTGNFKNIFEDWVNTQHALPVEKQLVRNKFKDLADQGLEPFYKIQAGDNSNPRFGDVRTHLNAKFKQAEDAGLSLNYQQDYLPQMWDNPAEEVAHAFGGIVNRAGFTMEKVIEDYKTGIEKGLTPKFNNIPDLLAHYEGQVNKAVGDRKFVNTLSQNNVLSPFESAPKDWVTLNPDKFPRIKTNLGSGQESLQQGPFKAPKEVANKINNFLYDPKTDGNGFQKGLSTVADFVSGVKNRALSFGVPGTAINAHGINIMARHTIMGTGGNPISRLITSTHYLFDQHASGKFLDQELASAPDAIKHGLTLSAEEFKAIADNETTGKFGQAWHNVFEKPLFDKMLPALKLSSYKEVARNFAKTMDTDTAGKEAAKLVNNVYGGINWEQMGRSRDFQNFLRAGILAPDWNESTLRLGGNMLKSFKTNGEVAGRYRTMMATMVGAYVSANVANKLSSGHYMYENDPGHTFEIETGYTGDGQKRYFRPFGTAADMIRLPHDIALSLKKGDLSSIARVFRNRLSIPAGVALGTLTDTDYRGQAIGYRGKDKYGNEIPAGQRAGSIAGEAATFVGLPSFMKQGLDTLSGKQGVEQGVTQAFELPVRYQGGAYSKSQKTVQGVGQAGGLKGKELYDLNKKMQGITLSKNQSETLRQGGINSLQNILDTKVSNSQKKQAEEIINQVESGDRAKSLVKEFEKAKSQEEKDKLWDHYVKTGVINKKIARQMKLIMQK